MNRQSRNAPDALSKQFPKIRTANDIQNRISLIRPTHHYKMGKVRIAFCPEHEGQPDILVISRPDRYPSWDEIVYIRYSDTVGIDSHEEFALILPDIDDYINVKDGGHGTNTFTLENVRIRREYYREKSNT